MNLENQNVYYFFQGELPNRMGWTVGWTEQLLEMVVYSNNYWGGL